MKKLLIYSFFVLMMAMPYKALANHEETMTVIICNYDPQYDTLPERGNRMPVYRKFCVIDFVSNTISETIQESILSYELWDEDGDTLMLSTETDFDMVSYLSTLQGRFQLRIVTENSIYMGHLEL